jgi:hypothetical protein
MILFAQYYVDCPGFKKCVTFPVGYDKEKPDSTETGIATMVNFWFEVKQLIAVDEERNTSV